MSDPGPRLGFPWWAYALALAFILIFALWPIASVLLTYVVADANGCVVNEASANGCLVAGTDWGGTLYTMGVMGWFGLITLPLGAGAAIVWFISLLIHRLAWQKHKDAEQ
ncbi:hypothetical protein PSQ90_08085 [Devosia rhodophyticola]|uniref:Uncharacterized protein n=1 Tax=Devosia rhodophyticola TaxID=3026423 RepID=A0ABY7Z2Z9_9HYPH|nr:hypothetical protein [Devosia rhodophyticola]WDR07365.1 hypothetical protein PSQ90_08085 [Devosia rhodophyticola]